MDAENEGVENGGRVTIYANDLPPERKGYFLQNPPNINYNDERDNQRSMGRRNLIVGARDLQNVAVAYVEVVNTITTFVEPTPQTNILKNETILTQYIIKHGIQLFQQKGKSAVRKELQQFHNHRVVESKKPHGITY